ncbi:MAG: putative toxin-antitoxin system toxin component, PIN family [Bacteroidota bacterium]
MKNKKVILDTNIWISFLISRDFNFLDNYIETGKMKLIFSEELFSEFISVAERPKFKKYFAESDVKHLILIINRFGILVHVTTEINRCRDIKDNFLLSLAIDSNADYLVTGDNDLLALEHINETKILTIQGLRNELK